MYLQIYVEGISKLEIRESPDDVTTYEVYRSLKEIRKLKKNIPKELVDDACLIASCSN